jgi:hypothetical protein
MAEESLLKYSRKILIKDSIINIFKSYINVYNLQTKISEKELDKMVDHFSDIYMDYIIRSFEELNIQIHDIDDAPYVAGNELMTKVAGMLASKLAAEILMLDIVLKYEKLI